MNEAHPAEAVESMLSAEGELRRALDGRPAATCQDHCVIGRSRHADIVVDHPAVSRAHLELRRSPLAVRDLGSSNGTVLHRAGSHHPVAADRWTRLRPGDRLTTSSVELVRIDAVDRDDTANPANTAAAADNDAHHD